MSAGLFLRDARYPHRLPRTRYGVVPVGGQSLLGQFSLHCQGALQLPGNEFQGVGLDGVPVGHVNDLNRAGRVCPMRQERREAWRITGLSTIRLFRGVRSKAMLGRTCRRGSGAWVDGTYALTGFSDPCIGINPGMTITCGC